MNQITASLLFAVLVSQIASFATTIYLHRGMTHKGIKFHPISSFIMRFILWITTGIITKEWVAVHRKHHAFTDKEGDPHSPKLHGFWNIQLFNLFYYIKEKKNKATVEKYSRDLHDDVFDKVFFNHGTIGIVIGIIIPCVIFGIPYGLLAAATHALLYMFVLSPTINGLCHYIGYKNFDNTATNLRSVALVTAGEGLHNNHHAYPSCPKLSMKKSEFDPAWLFIKTLNVLGLCQHGRTVSIDAKKSEHAKLSATTATELQL